ncbi:ABC transporter ATP-binding protein [Salipaludibacillus sp. HK11]|uniref:ABC transporter ATP-binding protein n=1 Tax=Salipaludibacillus sp. HK11 TaxID=3394320 RepID=UPI0039FC56EB
MAKIVLDNIVKRFENDTVVNNLNLTIKDGSFTVIVGPSGCGKSTTLRMIAGLEKQTEGDIWIGDRCVNDVSPGKRDVAMVFQNYALYPTMTVRGNIEFGLKNRKIPKRERQQLINEISEIVGLTNYLDKKPQTLSGGQRQRVALARAMVKKPEVFILDEPLSNLDAKLRNQMRAELVELHQKLGTTFVYVTHDQMEAMSMGSDIVILNEGEIQQVDPPLDVYHSPTNLFTAQFIGTPPMNVLKCDDIYPIKEVQITDVKAIGFRPEYAQLVDAPTTDSFFIKGKIVTRETLGSEIIYQVKTSAGMVNVKEYLQNMKYINDVYVQVPEERLYYFKENGDCMKTKAKAKKVKVAGGV